MDFRKELAKELRLGAIAENTMPDNYVRACEAIAVRYHESEVKKFRLGVVVGQSEQLLALAQYMFEHQNNLDGKTAKDYLQDFLSQ